MAAPKGTTWRRISDRLTVKNISKNAFDPHHCLFVMICILFAEVAVNMLVINKVKYTEIDWVAYMQEVEGVVNGTYNYSELQGDTGPLVYPAGFVYIFMGLYYITSQGSNIRLAQYIFAFIYILTVAVVFYIYKKTNRVPPFVYFFMCCTSYRIHSIYVLRLFNDPVAMIFLYIAIIFFIKDKWTVGCIFYSIAVSIKMNIMLFAPALLLLLLARHGTILTVKYLCICAVPQVLLAIPFILVNPWGYIAQSFNFGRKFFFKWTVNWRFLPEDIFLNSYFHIALLVLHVLVLVAFLTVKWKKLFPSLRCQLWMQPSKMPLTPTQILLPMFTANFIGMCFSRSLHYQFYVWYFHTLHFLVWSTPYHTVGRLLLLGMIEMCWNTYPSTVLSSTMLHCTHAVVLYGLWSSPVYSAFKEIARVTKMH